MNDTITDWNKTPDCIVKLMEEFPKYAAYLAKCKFKPRLYFEYHSHFQTFQVMGEGLTESNLKRVKNIIRGKIRRNSSAAKKYHKEQTDWTFDAWTTAYISINVSTTPTLKG